MLIASPEGFFVKGRKGPLKKGELKRAASWAKVIVAGLGFLNFIQIAIKRTFR